MKHLISSTALAAVYLATSAIAFAQSPPVHKGPVWDCAQIRTKDGRTDDYMKWVATQWKAQEEALVKGGFAIGYSVYSVVAAREGEPDVLLCTEFKNMAAFDTPQAKVDAFMSKQFGSQSKADQQEVARGSMRTVLGDVMLRQLTLK
jgi:hypothetical protein